MSRFTLLFAVTLFAGCTTQSFETDPLCEPCIANACSSKENILSQHLATLSDDLTAQLISRAESLPECINKNKIDAATVERAYSTYAPAFFDGAQPYLAQRANRAIEAISQSKPYAEFAAKYLIAHKNHLDAQVMQKLTSEITPLIESNDAAFQLEASIVSTEQLTPLTALDPTPARNQALLSRYPELDAETRARVLKDYTIAAWHMQQSGSTLQPQFLELDWGMRPLPAELPQVAASICVESVTVKGDEAKKRGEYARDRFKADPITLPNRQKIRVDLGPWLKTADTYRVTANALLKLWPQNTPGDCQSDNEPLAEYPVKLDFTYRVYVGVETGAPSKVKAKDENTATSKALKLKICNESKCTELWNGKATDKKSRETLDVIQGHDFYLLADVRDASIPVAGRLMARAMPGASWQEVATFFSFAPSLYAPTVRANIDVSHVCKDVGKCNLEFQLKPSLRMARRDPAIKRYWGDTLELGSLPVNIQNRTPSQVYKNF